MAQAPITDADVFYAKRGADLPMVTTTAKEIKDYIGGGVPKGTTAPATPAAGDLWVDMTTATAPALKSWNGAAWVLADPQPLPGLDSYLEVSVGTTGASASFVVTPSSESGVVAYADAADVEGTYKVLSGPIDGGILENLAAGKNYRIYINEGMVALQLQNIASIASCGERLQGLRVLGIRCSQPTIQVATLPVFGLRVMEVDGIADTRPELYAGIVNMEHVCFQNAPNATRFTFMPQPHGTGNWQMADFGVLRSARFVNFPKATMGKVGTNNILSPIERLHIDQCPLLATMSLYGDPKHLAKLYIKGAALSALSVDGLFTYAGGTSCLNGLMDVSGGSSAAPNAASQAIITKLTTAPFAWTIAHN